MDSKQISIFCAIVFTTIILLSEFSSSHAQVTFSRDWNAGKRSASECSQMSIRSAATICQMLLRELKSLAACEMHSYLSSRVPEEVENTPDLFSSSHSG